MKYRPEIDGLRALAVVPVILFHAEFLLFSGGFIGVDIFFVISGYLITTLLIDDIENGSFSVLNFYERRARRILPALFFVMLTCLPFAWIWMLPAQMQDFSQSLIAVSLFISNILFWLESGYFEAASEEKPLLHTWSLAVEEQYYLIFPIFLFLVWRLGESRVFWIIVVLSALSLLMSEWGWRNRASANFYLAPTRAWELFAGSIAAFVVHKHGIRSSNALSLLGLAAVIYAIFEFDANTPFPSVYALVPVVGTVLIIIFAHERSIVTRLLSLKFFVGLGLISYSAYLWHQPVFAFARLRSDGELHAPAYAVLTAAALLLAVLSWRFVETPFRNRALFARPAILAVSLSGLIAFVGLGALGHGTDGFPGRFPTIATRLANTNMLIFEQQVSPCWSALERNPGIGGACQIGAEGAPVDFVLLGDSHAAALHGEISRVAREYGLGGLGLSYRSCPPLNSARVVVHEDYTSEVCDAIRADVFNPAGLDSLPEVVIVSARWALLLEEERYSNDSGHTESGDPWVWDLSAVPGTTYKERMAREIYASLDRIIESGRKLVVVYPVPELAWSAPDQLAKAVMRNHFDSRTGAVSYQSFRERNQSAYEILDRLGPATSIVRIYPESHLCEPEGEGLCLAQRDDQPLYLDDDHISPHAAGLIAADIFASVTALRGAR